MRKEYRFDYSQSKSNRFVMLKIELKQPENWIEIQETIDEMNLSTGDMVFLAITMLDVCMDMLDGIGEKEILQRMLINHFKDNQ